MGRSPEPQASARRCGCHYNATCSFFLYFIFGCWVSDLFDRGLVLFSWIVRSSHCGFEALGVLVLWVGSNLYWVGVIWWWGAHNHVRARALWIWELSHCGFWHFGVLWVRRCCVFGVESLLGFCRWLSLSKTTICITSCNRRSMPFLPIRSKVWYKMSCGMVDQNGNV